MRRRRLLWLGTGIAIVFLLGAALLWLFVPLEPADGITPANRDRIRKGMSREAVEAILGERPGTTNRSGLAGGFSAELWYGNTGGICVIFDGSDHVRQVNPFDPKVRRTDEPANNWERLGRLFPW